MVLVPLRANVYTSTKKNVNTLSMISVSKINAIKVEVLFSQVLYYIQHLPCAPSAVQIIESSVLSLNGVFQVYDITQSCN